MTQNADDTDAYYGDDETDEELDLSFLDEDESKDSKNDDQKKDE